MRFVKMQGLGNDYVYVECFTQRVADPAALARRIADRHFGVGGDGLILVMPSETADVRMRMFNADGSESEMCGNGVRCVAKLAWDDALSRANPMRVETGAGVKVIGLDLDAAGKVRAATVDMGAPILPAERIPVVLPGRPAGQPVVNVPWRGLLDLPAGPWLAAAGLDAGLTCVSMGNPHAVLYCRDVSAVPLETVGPAVERAAVFPRRANTHFVQVDGPAEVTMRTWERGSGITLACGTGASAVCVAGVLTGRTGRRLHARLDGGGLLLEWPADDAGVRMTGPAIEVFRGDWPQEE